MASKDKRKLPDQLIELVNLLGYTDMQLLRDHCDARLVAMSDEDGYHYDLLRTLMHKRYSTEQVDQLNSWTTMKSLSRARFANAWHRAHRYLTKTLKLRLSSAQACGLVIDLVARSKELNERKLRFVDLIGALEELPTVFDDAFPNYSSNPQALELLNKMLDKERGGVI